MSFALLPCVPDGTRIGKCREPQLSWTWKEALKTEKTAGNIIGHAERLLSSTMHE